MTTAPTTPAPSTPTDERSERHLVIVRGGPAPDPRVLDRLPPCRSVIAVDRGYEHARTLGLDVSLVVGDLDSVSDDTRAHLDGAGIPIERYPRDKDATDLELALEAAAARMAGAPAGSSVTVLGGAGWEDRFDHLAAQIGLLGSPRWAALDLRAWLGAALVLPVHADRPRTVSGRPGAVVSLVPVGGPAEKVTTGGLRFPLDRETLDPFATRGVSNELATATCHVSVRRGVLLLIVPAALEGDLA